MLYEILSKYGFNKAQSDEVLSHNSAISGQQFYSATHRLIKDRQNLILLQKEELDSQNHYIHFNQEEITQPIHISLKTMDVASFILNYDKSIASLDANLIEFPLTLRHWQQGDTFKPLGMKGFKKLSDFFIDEKFSQDQKESCWLLLSGDDVIWVVGYRIDDRFKITPKTTKILTIEL